MQQITSATKIQDLALELRAQGKRIALVPTMGALHEGHLHLVDVARAKADVVVMSIFVNPSQFGPGEDFEKYPRQRERDAQLASERGVDILFVPEVSEIYPKGEQTQVLVTELTRGLCGPFRPGHFRGVTTVVAKLFLIVQPHLACFGEKDYQQLRVIQKMVRDLHFPITIVPVPTLREKDGLAMSSRNAYLKPQDREAALKLSQATQAVQQAAQAGERQVTKLLQVAGQVLASAPELKVEYVEIVDAKNLSSIESVVQEARIILAANLNSVRLIDNGPVLV